MIKPINRHPILLTINVASGKLLDQYFETKTEVKYRSILPKPPPKPIIKAVFSIAALGIMSSLIFKA